MNIELALLAVMLKTGNFAPILNDDITEEHFATDTGITLYKFIRTYKKDADGAAQFPSLKIVRSRFDSAALELADPDEGDTVENLLHELKVAKLRTDLRQVAEAADALANSSEDPTTRSLPWSTRCARSRRSSSVRRTSRSLRVLPG